MGNVSRSQPNNIRTPDGNSLAVFVDGVSGIMMIKDIMGNIQPLSDYISGGGGGSSPFQYDANATGIEPILGTNIASGTYATIGGGTNNVSSCFTFVLTSTKYESQNFHFFSYIIRTF